MPDSRDTPPGLAEYVLCIAIMVVALASLAVLAR